MRDYQIQRKVQMRTSISIKLIPYALFILMLPLAGGSIASADSEPYLGEIKWVALDFCPTNGAGVWVPADGRELPIAQNAALFSLLLTRYGGDGEVTFAVPDLSNAILIPAGSGGNQGNGGPAPWSQSQNGQGQGGNNSIAFTSLLACIATTGLFPTDEDD